MGNPEQDILIAALRWHVDEGIAEAIADEPQDATAQILPALSSPSPTRGEGQGDRMVRQPVLPSMPPPAVASTVEPDPALVPLYEEAYGRYRALYPAAASVG